MRIYRAEFIVTQPPGWTKDDVLVAVVGPLDTDTLRSSVRRVSPSLTSVVVSFFEQTDEQAWETAHKVVRGLQAPADITRLALKVGRKYQTLREVVA